MAPQASLALLLALLATASFVQAQRTQGQAPVTPPNFIRKNGLIKGDLVVLSVWSLLPDAPLPLSETNCAAACARTPRCNAYSYCPDSDGCGSGCLQYTQEHPQMQEIMSTWRPAPGASYNTAAWANLTTIDRFGPWGSTANCGVPGRLRRADRWPHNMCMLKKAAPGVGTRAPAFEQDREIEDDWRSGYLPTSTFQCGSLPLTTCYKCIGARDTKACLRCANTVSPKLSLLAKVAGSTRMDFCDGDVSSLAAVTCLEENAPCAQCVTWKNQSRTAYNSSRCIDCLQAFPGQAFLPACQHCANLGTPALVDQCMACLEAMKPYACNATHTKDCWSPTLHAQSCAKCANSNATSNQQCVACMQAKPASLMCDTCSALNATDPQKALCYNCTVSTSAMGCNMCFKNGLNTAQQHQCLACMVDPTISNVTKYFCADCAKSCATTEEYEQCIQCLGRTLPYNTSQACMCQKKVANTPGFTTFHPPTNTTNSTGTPGRNSSNPGALTTPEALINTTTPNDVDSTASTAHTSTNGLAILRQRLRLDKRDASAAAAAGPTADRSSNASADAAAAANTSSNGTAAASSGASASATADGLSTTSADAVAHNSTNGTAAASPDASASATADGSSTTSADAAIHNSTNGTAAASPDASASATADGSSTTSADAAIHNSTNGTAAASPDASASATAVGSSTASTDATATTVTNTSSVALAEASSGTSTDASALSSVSTTTAAPTNVAASALVVSTPVIGPSSIAAADIAANASTNGSPGAADASPGASADANIPAPLDGNSTAVDMLPATNTTFMEHPQPEASVANSTAGVVEAPLPDADATAPAL